MMHIKKTVLFTLSLFFVFIATSKPIVASNEIEKNETNVISRVKRAIYTSNESDVVDPNFIFENAINEYQIQFANYIDVTGLNVSDKEAI